MDYKSRITAIIVDGGRDIVTLPLSKISTIGTNYKVGQPLIVFITMSSGMVVSYHHNIVGIGGGEIDRIVTYYQFLASHAGGVAVICTPDGDDALVIGWLSDFYMGSSRGSRQLMNTAVYIESVTNFSITRSFE